MTYTVLLSPPAQKQLKRLDSIRRGRLFVIDMLKSNPFPAGAIALQGVDAFRLRIGSYRMLYVVRNRTIEILKVARRESAYDRL